MVELLLKVLLALLGAYGMLLWLSLVYWTVRDMRRRSRDLGAQLLAGLFVFLFTVPGLLVYLMIRPKETLTEVYERSLQQELYLQEIENRSACPQCRVRVEEDFLICPQCRTQLKQLCSHCHRLLQLRWELCPYCGTTVSVQPIAAEPFARR